MFLESYAKNPGGLRHTLVLIFKGFRGTKDLRGYQRLLEGYPHRSLFVSDFGYDIRPYRLAIRNFGYSYFCFLNSYSTILDGDWLAKMHRHACGKDVGLVGSTGSYGSWLTDLLDQQEFLRALPNYQGFVGRLRLRLRLEMCRRHYDPFPNYHIRTNGFMISGELARKIRGWSVLSKQAALRFESGKDGLTRQILSMGRKVLVVGRDGQAYEKEEWARSNTFWQADQGNLLIADNQTWRYARGDVDLKRRLSRVAWGPWADPVLSSPAETLLRNGWHHGCCSER